MYHTGLLMSLNILIQLYIISYMHASVIQPFPLLLKYTISIYFLFSLINEHPLTEISDPMYDCFLKIDG